MEKNSLPDHVGFGHDARARSGEERGLEAALFASLRRISSVIHNKKNLAAECAEGLAKFAEKGRE